MDAESLAERLKQAVIKDAQKPAIERWRALIEPGAIDSKGRVLLKAPRPMMGGEAKPKDKGRRPSK